jgi:hypothetical protein
MNNIARSMYYVTLAGHYKTKNDLPFIGKELKNTIPSGKVYFFNICGDFAFIVETHTRLQVVFRGTHGLTGWLSNCNCLANKNGFHTGFYNGFMPFCEPILTILDKSPEKVIEIAGHSRGCPFALLLSYFIRIKLRRYTKPILFCPPKLCTRTGVELLKSVEIDCVNVISYNDCIDNIGVNGFFGIHYGTCIKLPRSREYTFIEKLKDLIPSWGHSYTEVIDGLVKYFYGRGMSEEAEYLKSIRHLATI